MDGDPTLLTAILLDGSAQHFSIGTPALQNSRRYGQKAVYAYTIQPNVPYWSCVLVVEGCVASRNIFFNHKSMEVHHHLGGGGRSNIERMNFGLLFPFCLGDPRGLV
ncbi:hypothetical protein, unlikely [Trypanosoma brucei gambiense DAL972]|uniref:Uncharacterized protein n=1 Tax=Trypanosoma brucei gambiense (strain MHOM/CI/86/DAL972) TaxID=679716 RepID=D0A1R4_TRYB9|nr:hypothetical protein, unlikely [Trypanosoma brucei gambiense DAL972]CBH15207.1 hypothetical protein, unlikely [Trypanosoma brucei gambiense DAL972]|eukprot:XP_011777472.1 hypothetical protein, unlikely [Trypanosoma brucei gambiense DAL972]